ncbi:type I-E CRISPR-associated protein Cse2/CasB (plasmid) [Tistrella mobilis]|uniref:type I-E CRISPR-associated protein Cse2/CasB n=1 Tax=Tistrella mobilis TaxID=171437 RepID=UPI0035580AB1
MNLGQIAREWWRDNLRPQIETGSIRGFRARLRRADHPFEALADHRVIALHGMLDQRPDQPLNPRTLAVLVQLLAMVEADQPQRIARAFGTGEPARLSPLRFQRLIHSADRTELTLGLRRALPLVGNSCNVAALAQDILYWGEEVRIRWCFDYFGKTPPETQAATPGDAASGKEKTA